MKDRTLPNDNAYWAWLQANPQMGWRGVAKTFGVVPIAAVRRAIDVAPDLEQALRQDLMRECLEQFPDGWDPESRFAMIKFVTSLESMANVPDEASRELLNRLEVVGRGWLPEGPQDSIINMLVSGLAS